MVVMMLQVVGVAVFVSIAIWARSAISANPTPENAERISRIGHAGFYGGEIAPYVLGMFIPGAAELDRIANLPAFPLPMIPRLVIGVLLLVPSAYFSIASNRGLAKMGKGTAAFKLTRRVVTDDAYGMVRNPMAVGFYAGCVSFAFLFGSVYLLMYAAILIAAHVFYLKFLEERELSVRYGESYDAYRASTPFLVPRLSSSHRRRPSA